MTDGPAGCAKAYTPGLKSSPSEERRRKAKMSDVLHLSSLSPMPTLKMEPGARCQDSVGGMGLTHHSVIHQPISLNSSTQLHHQMVRAYFSSQHCNNSSPIRHCPCLEGNTQSPSICSCYTLHLLRLLTQCQGMLISI